MGSDMVEPINERQHAPFVSIVIPVYNVAPYLRQCLDSLLMQTYGDWEAICVDDGSTDESSAVLDEYASKDARFIVRHIRNSGVSAARNVGIDLAKGEWLEFVDSDDFLEPDHIMSFRYGPMDKADINFFPHQATWESGEKICYRFPPFTKLDSIAEMARKVKQMVYNGTHVNFLGYTWNKFIRMDLVKKFNLRFVEGFENAEDEVFAFHLVREAESIAFMDAPLYQYRVRVGGLTDTAKRSYSQSVELFKDIAATAQHQIIKSVAITRCCEINLQWANSASSLTATKNAIDYISSHKECIIEESPQYSSLRAFSRGWLSRAAFRLVLRRFAVMLGFGI